MYKRILVPIDGSDASRSGLREAIQLAKALGASLRLVHGVNEMFVMGTDYTGMYVDDFLSSLREGGRDLLEKAQLEARNAGLEAETQLIEALGHSAADLILDQAREWGADLIVMGTHGRRGIRRVVLGSDAEQVLREAPIPVLLVKAAPSEAK